MSNDMITRPPCAGTIVTIEQERAASTFNLASSAYLADMAEFEMTEAQQIELLQTIWSIMRSFVELGFEVKICEQLFSRFEEFPSDAPVGVSSLPATNTEMPGRGGKE